MPSLPQGEPELLAPAPGFNPTTTICFNPTPSSSPVSIPPYIPCDRSNFGAVAPPSSEMAPPHLQAGPILPRPPASTHLCTPVQKWEASAPSAPDQLADGEFLSHPLWEPWPRLGRWVGGAP